MTLSIEQLRERVATRFSDVEQVDDSIVRSTRKLRDLPFAVYYFDLGQNLPETQESLTQYQDRVIGAHYFEGKRSLQWSNYLYFLASGSSLASRELRNAKELIERDRAYARKFVISEEELDSVLAPQIVAPLSTTPQANVLSVWTERLIEAGLDKAILDGGDLPSRLKAIEASSSKHGPTSRLPKRSAVVTAAPFLRSFEIKKFRDFPSLKSYAFGTVNLICGPNGSGKTSLLEAIELFYCGRNKRNPKGARAYELVVTLADGSSERATGNRGLQVFRDRNLNWYGQHEVKTSNLFLSFAQFNFLDTDAAVGLTDSDSTDRIEEDLSKLLVGPDASKTWRDIERVYDAVSTKLRDLRPVEKQTQEDLAVLEKQLRDAGAVRRVSDSVWVRLAEMNRRLGWPAPKGDKAAYANRLVESSSELLSVVEQAGRFDWTESPVSIAGLAAYCRDAETRRQKLEADLATLENLRNSQHRLSDSIKRAREALSLVQEARRLVDAGVPERVNARNGERATVAKYSGILAGLDPQVMLALSSAYLDSEVGACYKGAASRRAAAQRLLDTAKAEHEKFKKLRDQSVNLAQELRQIGLRILKSGARPNECPLCHTQFKPGDLEKHMNAGVDNNFEALGNDLQSKLREHEAFVREAKALEAASAWLKEFCERASRPASISVQAALVELEGARKILAEATARLETLNTEVGGLESRGLAMSRLEEISTQLRELKYPLTEVSLLKVDASSSAIAQDLARSSRALESEKKKVEAVHQRIAATTEVAAFSTQNLKRIVSQLGERITATESIHEKLKRFVKMYPWPARKPLAALAVEARSVGDVAGELQAALGREKHAKTAYTQSVKQRQTLHQRLTELQPRIGRLNQANTVLKALQREHSLTTAMDSVLNQNRDAIEKIFLRIHSPAEFRGLGSRLTTLTRKVGGKEATLSEISTGQRAAFALSIFLAQNAQLRVAPPVVLIDDPIAHVDDLNSLSFLDYLRDVVLTDRRQIFFATASSKLATLFERKFDFLGPSGFRRYDLARSGPRRVVEG